MNARLACWLLALLTVAPLRAQDSWQTVAPMSVARFGHSMTVLADGRVLALGGISGGHFIGNAEVFDPSTGLWTGAASSASTRYFHTATLLPDGRVLVTGGRQTFGGISDVVELFDPGTLSFTQIDNDLGAAESHAAVRLASGDVAVLHGTRLWRFRSGESRWERVRLGQGGAVLEPPYRGVLQGNGLPAFAIQGGAVISHPLDGSAPVTLLAFPTRVAGNAELLRRGNGSVLVGSNERIETLGGTGLGMPYRSHYTLAESSAGAMLIGGWDDQFTPLASTLVYDNAQLAVGPALNQARARHSSVRLLDGRVLVCGGVDNGGMDAIAGCEMLGQAQAFDDLALEPLYRETQPGQFEVTLRVRHVGGQGASGAALQVLADSGLRILSSSASQGSFTGGNWSIGSLAAGNSATLVIELDFDPGTAAESLDLQASLTASAGNQDTANDSARITLQRPRPNVRVLQSGQQSGTQLIYTLRVEHDGLIARTFSDLSLQSQMSPGQTLVQASPDQGSFDAATMRWQVGALASGASAELRLVADVNAPEQADLFSLASALVQSTPTDADSADNGALSEVDYQPITQPASVGGRIWHDLDGDGVQSISDGSLPNVQVYLLAAGTLIASQTSDLQGRYRFDGLQPGPYTVEVGVLPNQNDGVAWLPTAQGIGSDPGADSDVDPTQTRGQRDGLTLYAASVSLAEGEQRLNVDAGLHQGLRLSGRVWLETTQRGIEDPQEPGLPNQRIELYADGVKLAETQTDSHGFWQLLGVGCACNRTLLDLALRVADIGGRAVSPRGATVDDQSDNDFVLGGNAGQRWAELLLPGSLPTRFGSELDAGLFAPRVRGTAFEDLNGDGLRDPQEPPLAGIRFGLHDSSGTARYAVSGSDGRYAFDNVVPGDYQLAVYSDSSDPAPLLPTRWLQGSDRSMDSDFSAEKPVPTDLSLADHRGFLAEPSPPLQTIDWYDTVDAGLHRGTLLRGKVWRDSAPLGTREDGEAGLPGQVVSLYVQGASHPLAQAITDADGDYQLRGHCLCNQPVDAVLRIDYSPEFSAVPSGLGNDPGRDSNFDRVADGRLQTAPFALRPDRPRTSVDAGLSPERGRISVSAWHDLDFDGVRGLLDPDLQGPGDWLLFRRGVDTPVAQAPVTAMHSFVVSEPGDYRIAWRGAACYQQAIAPPGGGAPGGGDNDFIGDPEYDGATGWFTVALGQHVADINLGPTERSGLIARTRELSGGAITPNYTFHQPDAHATPIPRPFATLSNGDMVFDQRARVSSVIRIPPLTGRVLLGAAAGYPEIDPPHWRSQPLLPDPGCNVFPAEASLYLVYRVVEFVAMAPQSSGQASPSQGSGMSTAGAPAPSKRTDDYWAELRIRPGSVSSARTLFLSEYAPGDAETAATVTPRGWRPTGIGLLFGALDGHALPLLQDADAAFESTVALPADPLSLQAFDPASQRWQPFEIACPGRTPPRLLGTTRVEFSACREGWYALFEPGPLFSDGFEPSR